MSNMSTEICVYEGINDKLFVFCIEGQVAKWRKDKTICLVDCVQSYQIYVYHGDVKGEPEKPDKHQL
eukprot:Awhi_evm1s8572